MKEGVISTRLSRTYELMVEQLRLPGETDAELIRRAFDALAVSDVDFSEFIESEMGEEDCGV